MKKIFSLIAMAAILSVAGCKKAGVTATVTAPEEGNVPVTFGLMQSGFDVSTKSVGPVDAWDGNDLYIFGYASTHTDYSEGQAYIYNVKATTIAYGEEGFQEGNTQQALKVEHDVTYDLPEGGTETVKEPFYYEGTNIYDFYGYYIDDAATNADFSSPVEADADPVPVTVTDGTPDATVAEGTVLPDGVYIPFQINGSQDIMIAMADKSTDVGETGVPESRAYSAYAARRGVHPNLPFEHQLARFKFKIVSGSEAGNNVNVNSVSLTSPSRGYLCVVGENRGIVAAANDTPTELFLKEAPADGKELTDLTPQAPAAFTEGKRADIETVPTIGKDILVIPGQNSYKLTLTTSMTDVHTEMADQTYTLTPANIADANGDTGNVSAFEAGKYYTITVIIYGLEEIKITATLGEWQSGGSITIDPDEEPWYDGPVIEPDEPEIP